MDGSFEAYGSPPIKTEHRWGRDDMVDRQASGNELYRGRRSPGKISAAEKNSPLPHLHKASLTPTSPLNYSYVNAPKFRVAHATS